MTIVLSPWTAALMIVVIAVLLAVDLAEARTLRRHAQRINDLRYQVAGLIGLGRIRPQRWRTPVNAGEFPAIADDATDGAEEGLHLHRGDGQPESWP